MRRVVLGLLLLAAPAAQAQDAFRWVVEPAFQDAGSAHQGVIPLKQGDLWGLMGPDGQWAVPPQFQAIGDPGMGRFPVKKDGKWGAVDLTGQVVTPFEFEAIGTIATVTPMQWQGQWWAIGPDGQPSDVPLPFQDLVGNDGTCMVGLENGRPIAVDRGDDPSVVRIDGIDKMSPPSEGYVAFRAGDLAGHLDCVFGSMIGGQPFWEETRAMREGLAAVKSPEGWGYVAQYSNSFEFEGGFEAAREFSEGLAPVKSGGKWGYIDRTGQFVIAPQFDQAYSFSDGLAGVQVGEKRGFILSDGSFAATPQFDDFWRHDGGVVPVRIGDLWGVIAPSATDPATRFTLPLAALTEAQKGRDTGFTLQPSNPHYYVFQDIASVHSVTVTPDQSVMLTTLALQSNAEVALWDFQSKRLIRKFPVPEATQAMLLPDTQIVAVGLSTGHLLLIDAVTGEELHRIRPMQGAILDMVLSPDGSRLAVTDGEAIQVWDAATGGALHRMTESAQKLRYSPDSTQLFAGNVRGGLTSFDREGALLARIESGPPLDYGEGPFFQAVPRMALTPQGVLVNLRTRSEQQADGLYATFSSLEVVSADGRREIPLTEGVGDILTLDVSADGRFVAYSGAYQDNFVAMVEIRDLDSGEVMFQQKLDRGPEAEAIGLTRGIFSMDRLAFTPDGALVLVGGEGQDILVLDPVKGRVTGSFGDRLTPSQQATALPDGNRFFATDGNGQVWVWDLAQGRLETRVQTTSEGYGVEEMMFTDGGQFYTYSGMEDVGVAGFDMETLQPIEIAPEDESYIFEKRENTEPVQVPDDVMAKLAMIDDSNGFSAILLAGGRLAVTSQPVGVHRVYDLNSGALLAQFLSTPDGEWLVVTPEGFFAASAKGAQLVSVSNGLRAFSVDQVYQALYRPDLVQAKLAGDPDGTVAKAAAELDLGRVMGSGAAPITRFSFPLEGFKAPDPEVEIEIELQDEGGGIGRVEWRLNGVTVQVQPTRAAAALDEDVPKAKARVALDPGQNVIEVVAYNAAGLLASAPRQLTVTWDGVASSEPPALHVLAVGVNDYADGRLQLKYAAADAQAFANAMKKAGAGLFSSVDAVTLLDADVTDAKLDAAFTAMAEKVKPQDVFLFFLAGHGKTVEGKYYFIPQDFRFQGDDPIRAGGIGQDRWQEWASRVRAKKSVMIYDTCESGSLTGSRSVDAAMAQTAAVERLTRAMGRTILSASTDDAPALEGYQGHGVMTWAMLDALGSGDLNGNATLEVTELASYLDVKVPEISSAAFGFRQVPQMSVQGSDFALGSAVVVLGDAPETFPATLSHVVAGGTDVLDAPNGAAVQVIESGVFYGVFKIEERDGFARIAKDGKALGWVPVAALMPLQ